MATREERKERRERFTELVRMRVTPEEKELIEVWAEKDSRTLSQFARVSTLHYIKALQSREALPELLQFIKDAQGELGDAEIKPPPPPIPPLG